MPDIKGLENFKNIHMRGIGGISMSGIAEILKNWGFNVTGSDDSCSENTNALMNVGIPVTIGYDLDKVINSDLVVYTAAMKLSDIELLKAKELNIPIIERADFLGLITKAFEETICISGTHGKTTTTSMISCCFLQSNLDPTIQVGAILKQINSNNRVGNSPYFILEACEYVESFLKFFPKTEVILNIDNDHLDYFKNLDTIKKSFEKYIKLLPENGLLVINSDDKNCSSIKKETKAKIITFGLNKPADFIAKNISFNDNGFPTFDVYYNNKFFETIQLSIPGKHNILNSLACIAVCYSYNISKENIKKGLQDFTGAHRRFEYMGTFGNNINLFDDYGHHPTEIVATANALKEKKYNQSWVIFQPHTYSRTKSLLTDFAKSLINFDNIIITDIYAAREKNTYNVSSQDLVNEISKFNREAYYFSDFNEIAKFIKLHSSDNDIVLTLGAGTVFEINNLILEDNN